MHHIKDIIEQNASHYKQLTTHNMINIKIRKISLYTGKALSHWLTMEKAKAIEFISNNQSETGAFYWISKDIK